MAKKSILLYSCFIWILSVFFLFYQNIIEFLPSVLSQSTAMQYKLDSTALGIFVAGFFFPHLILHMPAEMLIDRFGPRKMTSIGILLTTIGMLILNNSSTLYFAGFGRVLAGLGTAFAVVNIFKITTVWFPKTYFGFLTGLMTTCGMIGPIFSMLYFPGLIVKYGRWIGTELLTFSGLLVGIIFVITVRDTKEDLLHLKKKRKGHYKKKFGTIIKNPQNWLISAYNGLSFAPIMTFAGLWSVHFLHYDYELDPQTANVVLAFLVLGLAIGAPIAGFISDVIKRRKIVMLIGTIVSFLFFLAILYPFSTSYIYARILSFGFGFSSSAFIVSFALLHDINLFTVIGAAIGFLMTIQAFFSFITDPLVGFLDTILWNHQMGGFQQALLVIPVYLLISLGLLFFIKESNCVHPSLEEANRRFQS